MNDRWNWAWWCGLLGLWASPAWCALSWETRDATLKPEPPAKRVEAAFTFRNTGAHAVTIQKIRASCGGCTAAELKQKTYAPGEAGVIRISFERGDRKGLVVRQIAVQTDDPAEATVVLTMRIHLPDAGAATQPVPPALLQIEPPVVVWKPGAPRATRTVAIQVVAPGVNLKHLTAKVSGPGFEAAVKEVEAGKRYELTVKPPAGPEKAMARIRLEHDIKYGPYPVYAVLALAPAPEPAAKPAREPLNR